MRHGDQRPAARAAARDDDHFAYVAAWEHPGYESMDVGAEKLHKEALEFEYVHLAQRSYK